MLGPAETAIKTFVADGYDGLTIRWKGAAIPPEHDAGQAYIEAEIIGGNNSLRSFGLPGSRLFIHPGLIRFYIKIPELSDTEDAQSVSDVLAALLERVEFEAPTRPQIVRTLDFSTYSGIALDENGNFSVLMCSVPFDFYYQH